MRVVLAAGLVIASLGGAALAQNTEGGKVYSGDEGVQAAIVWLRPRTDGKALVQVGGTGGVFDGKARLHRISDEGSRTNYIGRYRGRDFYTVQVRNGQYQLWTPERHEAITLKYDDARSKALDAEKVFAAYQQQVKDGSLAALERFDREQRIKDAEKRLGELAAGANKACAGNLVAAVDWSSVNDELLGSLSIPSYCGAPLEVMRSLCESAAARAELSPVKKLACRFGSALALERNGDALAWTTAKEGANQEAFVRTQLLGPPPADDAPPWGQGQTLGEKIALEKTIVCRDKKAHYVIVAPGGERLFYGDGKHFFAVPHEQLLPGTMFLDPRHVNKTANPNFRGADMRLYSSVEAEHGSCEARCGEQRIPLTVVEAGAARPLLTAASFGPSPQQHKPHALFRDENGNYYYVDRGFLAAEEKRFRLFRGPKGSLKELKMTNVLSDSEGEIFSTRTGSLRLIIDKSKPTVWIERGKATTLREVPVAENLPLIYNELGVYVGERLGTPCDDL
jgi:hypothetical protein